MKTLVSFGSSPQREYCFLAPLTALLWRDVVGHEPRVFLVGSEEEWLSGGPTCAVIAAFKHLSLDYQFIGRFGSYLDATIAQSVRYHLACDTTIPDNQWIMQTDADLWPLCRYYYHQHADSDAKCVSYYSNGDHFISKDDVLERFESGAPFQSIPTCHVTMRAREWRSSYGLLPGDIKTSVKNTLHRYLHPRMSKAKEQGKDVGFEVWMSDQRIVTRHVCAQDWFPDKVLFLERHGHPPLDRLDRSHRSDWSESFDPSRWTDAHLPHPADSDEHWGTVLPILDTLLPEHSAWVRLYREVFVR